MSVLRHHQSAHIATLLPYVFHGKIINHSSTSKLLLFTSATCLKSVAYWRYLNIQDSCYIYREMRIFRIALNPLSTKCRGEGPANSYLGVSHIEIKFNSRSPPGVQPVGETLRHWKARKFRNPLYVALAISPLLILRRPAISRTYFNPTKLCLVRVSFMRLTYCNLPLR